MTARMDLTQRRVQPRLLAPILIGSYDIGSGITGLISRDDHIAAYTFAANFLPLTWWWVSFIAIGVAVLAGPLSGKIALFSTVIAFGWWLFFSDFVWQAHTKLFDAQGQHLVSLRGVWAVGWMAVLHLLLAPYMRREAQPSE